MPRGAARATHGTYGGTDVPMVHPRMTHGYGSSLTTNEAIATAGRLSEAMYRNLGTEEGEIFSALRDLSCGDIQKIAYHSSTSPGRPTPPRPGASRVRRPPLAW